MPADYARRQYLSVGEVSAFTGLPVPLIHRLVRDRSLPAARSAAGQYRFDLRDVRSLKNATRPTSFTDAATIAANDTRQRVITGDSREMTAVPDHSVHLAVTSPPYFNAKMYSEASPGDLGNVHDLDAWFSDIGLVWREVYRVLQPGRKFFLNIMNLPVREAQSFRCLNLVGKSVDLCESIGFIFKRDIIWHKTNGVRAHFGTYPYPGGILINNMHEFILEFETPAKRGIRKYSHVTEEQRASSRLDRDFWLSIKTSDVWLIRPEKSGAKRSHVAPFPIELPARLIRAYTFMGECVLDPFLGSGTSLVAAATLGRDGIGYEINPDFCTLATDRITNIDRRALQSLPFKST